MIASRMRLRGRNARGSIAELATASYATAALGILTGPLVARALGPSQRGEYATVMVYVTFTGVFLSFGMGSAVGYWLNNRLADPRALLGTVLKFAAITALPAVITAAVVVGLVLPDLSEVATWTCFALIAAAPVAVVGTCLQSFLLNRGVLARMTELTVAPLLINTVGVTTLAILGALTLTTYLALTVLGIVTTWVIAWRAVGLKPARAAPLRPLLRFGSRSYIGSVAGIANYQLDQLILAPLLGYSQLGYYAVAVSVGGLTVIVSTAIASRTWGNVSG